MISRHSSTDYAPAVEAYKRKKWCSVCHVKVQIIDIDCVNYELWTVCVQIVSEVYLMSHLRGRKHCEALQSAGLPEQVGRERRVERREERKIRVGGVEGGREGERVGEKTVIRIAEFFTETWREYVHKK